MERALHGIFAFGPSCPLCPSWWIKPLGYDGVMAKPEMNRPLMGTVFLVLGVAMLIYDGFHDWDTIWATAIGIKLIVVAIIFLVWDPLRRLDERERAKRERLLPKD